MKHFVVFGYKDGDSMFVFPVIALSSQEAVRKASKDELVRDMEFDKLCIEVKNEIKRTS